jgi:hypothetical protein
MPKKKKINKKKRIKDFLEGIDWLFQVNNFEKDIIYKKEDKDDNAAMIFFDKEYQRIIVKIYPVFFKHRLKDQRKFLLHELCHYLRDDSFVAIEDLLKGKVLTSENARRINESETSVITNILDGLLQGRLKYARDAYQKYLK